MNIEILQAAKVEAYKVKDGVRKEAISSMIDAVNKAAITSKGRVEITDQLVDEVLIKYQKTIQEMIDTCPAGRTELLNKYVAEMAVVKEFAPQLMTDKGEIERTINDILNGEVPLTKANKGNVMKLITPYFKGKADMKIVSQVVAEMLV
jgi:uncharacterized protein YqeY